MKFTEEKLEKAFTELLGQEGFPHHLGITITRKPEDVLIEEVLKLLIGNVDAHLLKAVQTHICHRACDRATEQASTCSSGSARIQIYPEC